MPTHGGCYSACWAYMQKPECRRSKSCPPDQASFTKTNTHGKIPEQTKLEVVHRSRKHILEQLLLARTHKWKIRSSSSRFTKSLLENRYNWSEYTK